MLQILVEHMDTIHPVEDNINVMYITPVTNGYQDKRAAKFVIQLNITAGQASCRNISATIKHGILPKGKMIM